MMLPLHCSWGPLSNCAAFHVQLDGRCHKEGCDYLLPGTLLAGWFESSNHFAMDSHVKVVVRMAAPVYESVARHTNRLRILQASVKFGDALPVIDTCAGLSVVAGAFVQQQHTQLEVAELFSGGFLWLESRGSGLAFFRIAGSGEMAS